MNFTEFFGFYERHIRNVMVVFRISRFSSGVFRNTPEKSRMFWVFETFQSFSDFPSVFRTVSEFLFYSYMFENVSEVSDCLQKFTNLSTIMCRAILCSFPCIVVDRVFVFVMYV